MDNLNILMREFLKKRGIVVEDKAGDPSALYFSVNNLHFIFETNDPDPFFFRISLPQINRDSQIVEQLSKNIQQLNMSYKGAKIVDGGDKILWIIADQFVYSTDQIDFLFDRIIQAMTDMIREYYKLEQDRTTGHK